MLKISRRCGESFHIFPSESLDPQTTVAELFASGPITVVVSQQHDSQVWLGIDAPKALKIARHELLARHTPSAADVLTRQPRVSAQGGND